MVDIRTTPVPSITLGVSDSEGIVPQTGVAVYEQLPPYSLGTVHVRS